MTAENRRADVACENDLLGADYGKDNVYTSALDHENVDYSFFTPTKDKQVSHGVRIHQLTLTVDVMSLLLCNIAFSCSIQKFNFR